MKNAEDVMGMSHLTFVRNFMKRYGVYVKRRISGTPVPAEVNHGRWIVKCPFCAGAEVISTHDPVFYCLSCLNIKNDGDLLPVLIPDNYREIEAELRDRKNEANQNWAPGERLDQLIKENEERKGEI
ncbi:hypothetical protein [Acidaminobacter hydrogenoformans]|uniref:Uncharacterized protein n=1 Tax=Acidaminobacter hydrogenoformans DSM 2784 TaxID=1120920 RepID=A0A1G5S256_9FIRM|nr:hypothetical protein [Acidaminobacter hydrogenoformans]SCZ80386.1 hypothetical protein SAMN03080599_02243 [Acidaminobacter hydrogenoformans DSM 2784]